MGATTQFYCKGGLGYLDEEGTQFAADQEIAEYSGTTLLRRYIRIPGSVDEPFMMIDYTIDVNCTLTSAANCERYAHQNYLGSVIAVTDVNNRLRLSQLSLKPHRQSQTQNRMDRKIIEIVAQTVFFIGEL